jgi:hypothetical protein
MAKGQRDYRKEYARRVAFATQKGLSRSAARGHPRAGERKKPATVRTVDPHSREERALKMMRRGSSLRDAAGHYRMSQERLRAYLKETTAATRENGRWNIVDHRLRQFPFYSNGTVVTPWMSLEQTSEATRSSVSGHSLQLRALCRKHWLSVRLRALLSSSDAVRIARVTQPPHRHWPIRGSSW